MLATNTTSRPDEVMKLMLNARSIRGSTFPISLIRKVKDLCAESGYNFIIDTGTAISRKKCFFAVHKDELRFYNQDGNEFVFDDEAKEIINNEVFVAVHFNSQENDATVYAYFPYDGAMR